MSTTPEPLADSAVGAAVRHLRKEARLSIDDLSRASGIGFQVISRIERGVRPCRVTELHLITEATGSTVDTAIQLAASLTRAVAEEVPCRRLAVHPPHAHRDAACPGVLCDHENLCCMEHGHHATPHRGCVLR